MGYAARGKREPDGILTDSLRDNLPSTLQDESRMAIYTQTGSEKLDAKIDADLRQIMQAAEPYSIAGILLGGYGRGDGTPFMGLDGIQQPFNDYDLVVVVEHLNRSVRRTFKNLESELSEKLGIPVDLYPYRRSHLSHCEFSLLNYEMKYGHKVIWGDAGILNAMPDYPKDAIPRSEGSRLLLNRGKLLLDIKQRLADPSPLTDEERIRFIKFIHKVLLAFGDASLIAAGRYDISYAVKEMRFPDIGLCPDRNYVVEGYHKAIELKTRGNYYDLLPNYDIAAEYEVARTVFVHFMPWYRKQVSGGEGSPLKNLLMNLKWRKCLCTAHPRESLYDAVTNLLQGSEATMTEEEFRRMQRRFS
ncbi:MAG: hypothetical protein JXR25_12665 [Pontiellaceae bacterium]|nr:hypothetical protein [Pontiellaceae bacterium]MBN2785669.1 hypothetical protein [Pontiellaceae bacterium]